MLKPWGRITGYYTLTGDSPKLSLDKLFVEPRLIATGRGKHPWRHEVKNVSGPRATVISFAADSNAAPFDREMGAARERAEPTTRPGRDLQMFRFQIDRDDEKASDAGR